jgi:hypothetical protein
MPGTRLSAQRIDRYLVAKFNLAPDADFWVSDDEVKIYRSLKEKAPRSQPLPDLGEAVPPAKGKRTA